MCMRVELNHAKNGFFSLFARSMKVEGRFRNSSSTVSMRFLSSGPVSSQFCLPHLPKRGSSPGVSVRSRRASEHAAWAKAQFELRILRIFGVLRFVLGIEMVEIAEELVETMNGRQKLVAVTEMVLAELSGHIAERLEQISERRILLRQSLLSPPAAQLSEDRCASGSDR